MQKTVTDYQPIDPGRMPHRVTVQRNTGGDPNPLGETPEEWEDVAERWARVRELSGQELWQAQQAGQQIRGDVTMRYFPGLTTAHRLLYGTRVLQLQDVSSPDGLKQWTVATFTEASA